MSEPSCSVETPTTDYPSGFSNSLASKSGSPGDGLEVAVTRKLAIERKRRLKTFVFEIWNYLDSLVRNSCLTDFLWNTITSTENDSNFNDFFHFFRSLFRIWDSQSLHGVASSPPPCRDWSRPLEQSHRLFPRPNDPTKNTLKFEFPTVSTKNHESSIWKNGIEYMVEQKITKSRVLVQ